ncbi:hemicentin-2-like isoform X1 [Sycon ciliatum]|uniref:hemicentin-2-like isoform X1 n=1 Tax=Sycon ciliatum TaxID=27933 RepID=UPI0031F636F2
MAASALFRVLTLCGCLASFAAAVPRFLVHPEDSGGKVGETLTFSCQAEGDAGLVLKWQVKRAVVTNDTSRRTIVSSPTPSANADSTSISSQLTMKDIVPSEAGAVMCLAADSSSQVATSRRVALTVYRIDGDFRQAPKLLGLDPSARVEIGNKVQMLCEPPLALPQSRVTWHRDGEPLPLDTRVTVSAQPPREVSTLTISHAVPTDNGAYTCQASNIAGVVASRGKVDLLVQEPAGDFEAVVVISPVNTFSRLLPGGTANFTCQAYARPPPDTVTWHSRQGKLLTANKKFIAYRQHLTVIGNSAGKNREAVCHANSTGGRNKEETLLVNSADLPDLTTLAAKSARESYAVKLDCGAATKSFPAPVFTWKDPSGKDIESGIRRSISYGTLSSSLEISPVSLSDAGMYTCTATNPLTNAVKTTSGMLSVSSSTKLIQFAPSQVTADISRVTGLPCEVQKNGMLEPVIWTHAATERSVGKHVGESCQNCRIYVEIDGTLVFSPPEEIDDGVWKCASSQQWVETNVSVGGKPFFINRPPEILEVTLGSEVDITCAAGGIPAPSVQWKNRYENAPRPFTGGTIAPYNSTMTLRVTESYHEARFQCLAGNQRGLSFLNIQLRIIAPTQAPDDSSNSSIVVTIAIVIPCAVLYIVAMVVLVLWCQKRRYRLHRDSKESDGEGEQEDEENTARELENIPRKDVLETVVEDAPPDYDSSQAPPATLTETGVQPAKTDATPHPVAEETSHETVRSKPPMDHLDEPSLDKENLAAAEGDGPSKSVAEEEAVAAAAPPVDIPEPESPPVLHTPIIFRAAEPHGISFTSLNEVPRFKREQCKINKKLGRGYFTTYTDVTNRYISGFAAADTSTMMTKFSASSQDVSGYTRDILALASLHHKNIASCVALSSEKHPYCILSEYYTQGDLKRVLLYRDNEDDLHLQYNNKLSTLLQLCDALQYLSARRFVHRDVACHSCLINSNYQVKLAFYSRSEDGYPDDYYTDVEGEEPLPVRWMAPEAIKSKTFTIQNDIWSFGVLMWEIFSGAAQPFDGTSSEDIHAHVQSGQRLPKPDGCPEGAFKTMLRCWETEPKDRLHFSQLGTRLHQLSSTSDL